jgi:hypothetical protein
MIMLFFDYIIPYLSVVPFASWLKPTTNSVAVIFPAIVIPLLGVLSRLVDSMMIFFKKLCNLQVREKLEGFLSTCGAKPGDNLASILFIFVIHAFSKSLDHKWKLKTQLPMVPRY